MERFLWWYDWWKLAMHLIYYIISDFCTFNESTIRKSFIKNCISMEWSLIIHVWDWSGARATILMLPSTWQLRPKDPIHRVYWPFARTKIVMLPPTWQLRPSTLFTGCTIILLNYSTRLKGSHVKSRNCKFIN